MRKELKPWYQKWPRKKGISAEKIPHYAKRAGEWRCKVGKYEERGDLEWVMAEFTFYNETYRFHLYAEETANEAEGWEDHEHSFSDVLRTLIRMPEHFSVTGYEDDYSKQQIALIKAVQKKLLAQGVRNSF